MTAWHTQPIHEALTRLTATEAGLTSEEAARRLGQFGPNELRDRGTKSRLRILWEQFTETMVVILIVAAVVSALLGKGTETVAILAIVVLFAVLGAVQEYRAERAMAALKRMAVPVVRVRRAGRIEEISARDLVPGDIVLLEAGNVVPADLRLIESANLRVQESALTGESEAVEKQTDPLPKPDLPLGDRRNMAYFGTTVTYGRGSAVVVETGMETELGRIAELLQEVAQERTPLQKRLDRLGKTLAAAGVAAAALVMVVGIIRGESISYMFLTGVSIAVAVVPEGLPAVVTITLALGAQRMLTRNALIRKLPAVETLGSVTVICSDKTGTLTENRMTVTVVDVAGHRLDLSDGSVPGEVAPAVRLALAAGVLCNDAVIRSDGQAFQTVGDPTETALLVAAARMNLSPNELRDALARVAEVPFDSVRKQMSTIHRVASDSPVRLPAETGYVSFTKGAMDRVLDETSHVWIDDRMEPLTDELRRRVRAANDDLAGNGMRVLGVAFRLSDDLPAVEEVEKNLVFIGLIGLIDPPREAVKPAVETCRSAGIRPVMITGDHPLTAAAIAREIAFTDHPEAIAGDALNRMSDADLETAVERTSIYARVSPEDKLRIVTALQRRGQVVAMTGDGVNDSPALKRADIGVAMGITGTDVAKEAADMVLLDDNFATIVAAVEEGRVIFDNLQRFIKFSLGGNLGKVLVMLAAPLFGITIALTPLQLLWLNLLTDGLMGLGLGLEPAEADTMRRPPRSPESPILDRPAFFQVSWIGVLIAVVALGLGVANFTPNTPTDMRWQTMIFVTVGFAQVWNAYGLRATGRFPFSLTSNPLMTVVTVVTLALQLAPVYLPGLERFFNLAPLSIGELATAFALGSVTFVGIHIERWLTHSGIRVKPRAT